MTSIDEYLAAARERLERVGPAEAAAASQEGALLIDIRSESQRSRDGVVPGATYYPRNVLEWRLDASKDGDRHVILFCDEGYASSLAAAALQDIGISRATDVDGGFQAWRAAGLPVEPA